MSWQTHIHLPLLGLTHLAGEGLTLTALWRDCGRFTPHLPQADEAVPLEFITNIKHQMQLYLSGQPCTFKIHTRPDGTEFQRQVWQALMQIPYGTRCDYGQLAAMINRPTATRAVANAIARNPLLIICPCHRVIRRDGTLGGFSAGTELKHQLLQLEGVIA